MHACRMDVGCGLCYVLCFLCDLVKLHICLSSAPVLRVENCSIDFTMDIPIRYLAVYNK